MEQCECDFQAVQEHTRKMWATRDERGMTVGERCALDTEYVINRPTLLGWNQRPPLLNLAHEHPVRAPTLSSGKFFPPNFEMTHLLVLCYAKVKVKVCALCLSLAQRTCSVYTHTHPLPQHQAPRPEFIGGCRVRSARMAGQKEEVFNRFVKAMNLQENKEMGQACRAYIAVIAAATAALEDFQSREHSLADPYIFQMLTLVEKAAVAARKTSALPSTLSLQEAVSGGAGAAGAGGAASSVNLDSVTEGPARATTGEPGNDTTSTQIATRSRSLPAASPLSGQLSPSSVQGSSRDGQDPLSPSSFTPTSPSPAAPAAMQPTPTQPPPPIRDYIADARRENNALQRQFERQRKSHHNPELLRISLLREVTANMEHAKGKQAALEVRLEQERADAAVEELRLAGEREVELRAQLKQTPKDLEAQHELAGCVMSRALAAMITGLENGTTTPENTEFCCMNQLVQHKMYRLLEAVDEKYPELEGTSAPHEVAVDAISKSSLYTAISAPCPKCSSSIATEAWLAALETPRTSADFGVNPAHVDGTDFSAVVELILHLETTVELGPLLQVVVRVSQLISTTMRDAGKGVVGAEDLLPLLAWLIHRAQPKQLPIRLRFCECLMSNSQTNGMEGYATGSTSIAANHIVRVALL